MNHVTNRLMCSAVFLVMMTCASLAAAPKVERTGAAPDGLSDGLRAALDDKGYKITLDGGWMAEFWFARAVKTEKKDVPGALYPELSNGEFVGVVRLPQGMADYRGQSLPAGTYTLRYQALPQDGNHMGVAPNPDFLLASPAADDARPEQSYIYKKLIALSARSTGSGHPAVLAMASAGEPATVAKQEDGSTAFTVELAAAMAKLKIGIVIKGSATQ